MENRINTIMTLADGSKYLIMKQAIYKNENYFVAIKLDSKEELTDEVRVLHEIKSDDTYVEDIKDLDLFDLIIKYVGLESKQGSFVK